MLRCFLRCGFWKQSHVTTVRVVHANRLHDVASSFRCISQGRVHRFSARNGMSFRHCQTKLSSSVNECVLFVQDLRRLDVELNCLARSPSFNDLLRLAIFDR